MAQDMTVDSAVLNANLVDIASAIRAKGSTSDPLVFPEGFVSAVNAIETGGDPVIDSLTVTPSKQMQTFNASSVDGYKPVVVNPIPSDYIIPSGEQTFNANGTYDVSALASAIISVSGGGTPLPTGVQAFDFGMIQIASQFANVKTAFPHRLGSVPDFAFVWLDEQAKAASSYAVLGAMRGVPISWRSGYNGIYFYRGSSSTSTTSTTHTNNANYGVSYDASNLYLQSQSSSYYWRAGTYKYIAVKFS